MCGLYMFVLPIEASICRQLLLKLHRGIGVVTLLHMVLRVSMVTLLLGPGKLEHTGQK